MKLLIPTVNPLKNWNVNTCKTQEIPERHWLYGLPAVLSMQTWARKEKLRNLRSFRFFFLPKILIMLKKLIISKHDNKIYIINLKQKKYLVLFYTDSFLVFLLSHLIDIINPILKPLLKFYLIRLLFLFR